MYSGSPSCPAAKSTRNDQRTKEGSFTFREISSGAPGYGRTWVHVIAFGRLKRFSRFFASHIQAAENTKKAHPLRAGLLPQRRGSMPCGAVWCRKMPCGAVLGRALPFFLFRTYQTKTEANIQSSRELYIARPWPIPTSAERFSYFVRDLFNHFRVIYTGMQICKSRKSTSPGHWKSVFDSRVLVILKC